MSEFHYRLSKLISLDKIRLGKFIEITQYSFIGVFITLLIMKLLSLINNFFAVKNTINDVNNKKLNIFKLYFNISVKVILSVIVVFYIRKIILLFPSIASIIINGFRPYTTIEYTIHVCTIFIVLELFYNLKEDLEYYYKDLYNIPEDEKEKKH